MEKEDKDAVADKFRDKIKVCDYLRVLYDISLELATALRHYIFSSFYYYHYYNFSGPESSRSRDGGDQRGAE